ncbi:hypothetical protein [Bradyrhizobium embrapense]|uniref:hypothetical protein n=1 Tax=Bradyrhizobium embrapense TaxID=630921 RepID=UPI00067AF9D4|nr:hypothetical protein [Bradyrhizobium embrapense]
MGATYFQDFTRDNGYPVTVEYGYSPGSETTYSPMHGACGGAPCEIQIVSSMPNTPAFERFSGIYNHLRWGRRQAWQRPAFELAAAIVRLCRWIWEFRARLSTEERERMEEWLAEHHVYEPYEPEDCN